MKRNRNQSEAIDAVAENQRIPLGRISDVDDIEALRAAIALRATRPTADQPSDEFVAQLHDDLADESEHSRRGARLSRRAMITGAVAAGSVAAGVTIGVVAERSGMSEPARRDAGPLEPTDGEWVGVATADEVDAGTVRFDSRGVIGFLSARDDTVQAVSGVCTHLGCALRSNATTGRLDCPCHRTSFLTDGTVAMFQLESEPAALPHLRVRRRGESIEVLLPPV